MPFKLPNAVQETTTTSGTGSLSLAGAVTDRLVFSSQLSNGDTVLYVIEDGTDWEVGYGTFTSPSTLSRDTVIYSTNGNALVDWPGSGTRNVFAGLAGEELASLIDPSKSAGFLAKTADRTYATRSLTAGFGINVANGDGVSGNPAISQTLISAGTAMLFYQASAPIGWTQISAGMDHALRAVPAGGSGGTTGGTTNFSTIMAAGRSVSNTTQTGTVTVNNTTLTAAHIQHTHDVPMSGLYFAPSGWPYTDGATYTFQRGGGATGASLAADRAGPAVMSGASGHNHTATFSGNTHSHTVDMNVRYADVIIATKDA